MAHYFAKNIHHSSSSKSTIFIEALVQNIINLLCVEYIDNFLILSMRRMLHDKQFLKDNMQVSAAWL